mmetsp:Transcript_15990/g.35985  ORF Transcript_15990/g.35985 Transcript_15990/m.35985 type:complete len:162 (-) Transcript_15990:257-742(-)|eukprot:CAMPEP_0113308520 /NCGR_PEP_ID=MMETSP0010_2-20120614/6933_1 /TAXON_ID=216773 ORGANISM="Corethron hystrix, Strain 308" /NCGR_SAMPLE_ID=MMETSP0010_2 /ASSEMBLY_ACC=CAM_ASM_000155 /LENGTH=161 /DNA_ID=CAMNT_0000163593 /DNA_START=102 /DNA_END=587 /DNA_ORIENTATION=+ /assembly_acc=CAM_ASM_000155
MARLSILFLLAIPSGSVAFAPQPFSRPVTKCSNVKRQMFSGSGGGADSLDEAEDAAKAMGMNLQEYQLAMRMRNELGETLTNFRAVGSNTGSSVKVTYDGNVKPLSVEVTDDAIASGKDQLEKDLVKAWGEAIEGAQKAAQGAMQKMQMDIATEMKSMGGK